MAKKIQPNELPFEHIIITTGDIKKEYEILGIVSCKCERMPYITWENTNKGYVPSTFEFPWDSESNTYAGIDELKKQCAMIGGDAIVFFVGLIPSFA